MLNHLPVRSIGLVVIAIGLTLIILELINQNATLDQNLKEIQEKSIIQEEELEKIVKQLNTSKDRANSCEEKLKVTMQQLNVAKSAEANLQNKLKTSTLQQDKGAKEQTELFQHILKPGSFVYIT